jgi:ankyrin repeat protein
MLVVSPTFTAKSKACLEALDSYGNTPLMCAVSAGNVEICEKLLERGSDLHVFNAERASLLTLSVASGSKDLVSKMLYEYVWWYGLQRLMVPPQAHPSQLLPQTDPFSASNRRLSTARYKMDVAHLDNRRRTPLHICAGLGHEHLIEILDKCGASVVSKDRQGATPLHTAAEAGEIRTCKALMKIGAPIAALDLCQRTPLHYAAKGDHPRVAEILIAAGCDSKLVDKDGKTCKQVSLTADFRLAVYNAQKRHDGIVD